MSLRTDDNRFTPWSFTDPIDSRYLYAICHVTDDVMDIDGVE